MLKLSLKLACICVPILFFAQVFGKFTPAETGDNRATYIAYATAQLCDEFEINSIVTYCLPDILIAASDGSTSLLFDPGARMREDQLAWSYDYQYLAYTDGNDIYVYDVEAGSATNITSDRPTHFEYEFKWSPTEHVLAFVSGADLSGEQRQLYVYNLDKNLRREIVGNIPVGDFSWSPDSSQILFSRAVNRMVSADLYIVETNGTGLKRLTTTDFYTYSPEWSSDGNHVLFQIRSPRRVDSYTIYMMDKDGSHITPLVNYVIASRPNARWVLNNTSILYAASSKGAYLAGITFYMLDLKTNIVLQLWQVKDMMALYGLAPTRTKVVYVNDNRFCLGNLMNGEVDCSDAKPYPAAVPAWGG